MKHYLKSLAPLLLFVALAFVSCQNEENETKEQDPKTLNRTSEITKKWSRTAMHNTSLDNRIDSTDVFSIKMPFTLSVNSQTPITVNTEADYAAVHAIMDQSLTNRDYVIFTFPITVIFGDYTERIAENLNQYELYRLAGFANSGVPVNCLTMAYPISISVYDSQSQNAEVISITNDFGLFMFLANLSANQYYQINFPILAVNQSGNSITNNNNDDLLEAMNNAIADCECESTTILGDGLTTYIPFGNEFADLTGFSSPTITGNYHFVTDRTGNPNGAISFDNEQNGGNTGVHINPSDTGNLLQDDRFTLSFWYNRQNANATQIENPINSAVLLINFNDQDNTPLPEPTIYSVRAQTVFTDPSWTAENPMAETGVWHHVVITYSGSLQQIKLYRDGVLRVTQPTVSPMNHDPFGMTFGNNFKGYMDDIRIYKRELNASEVNTLFEMEGDNNTCFIPN